MLVVALAVGLLPVLLFLAGLRFMDSYKLVHLRSILGSLLAGGAAALAALVINGAALEILRVDPVLMKRAIGPAVEEILKAAWVVWLVRRERVGFMVDAAIHGFAVGTGFALLENLEYARVLGGAPVGLWLVRGLGTAVMHGSTTAVVAMFGKGLSERHGSHVLRWFVPGVLVAIVVHAFFNSLLLPPLVSTALLLVAMPLLVLVVFDRSERATRRWLGAGLDADAEMLEIILGDEIHTSRVGRYLQALRRSFPDTVVGDMLCLLRIHLELSMRAKGLLMARAAGFEIPVDADVAAQLAELAYLERSIGTTGTLAMEPLRRTSRRDLWQLYLLRR
jgi:RsiW-degrading membrane proteinase PrsW (M82 family)